jgi:hypothetical protein
MLQGGRDSSVGIATELLAGRSGDIESRCGRDFPHPSIPTQPPIQWVPGFSLGGKGGEESGRGVVLSTQPLIFIAKLLKRVELYLYLP